MIRNALQRLYRLKLALLPDVNLTRIFPPIGWAESLVLRSTRQRLITDANGHRLHLDRYDALKLSVTPLHEPMLTEWLGQHIKPGMLCFDVGAHIGYFTLLMAKHAGPSGKVYAFEPHPEHHARLKENVEINGYSDRVVIIEKAASFEDGTAFLAVPGERTASSALSKPDGTPGHRVATLRLASLGVQPDVVKLDCEGHELQALHGADDALNASTIVTEFCPEHLSRAGVDPMDVIRFLTEAPTVTEINETHRRIRARKAEELIAELTHDSFTTLVAGPRRPGPDPRD